MGTMKLSTDLTTVEEKVLTEQLTAALDQQEDLKEEAAATAGEYREKLKSIAARIHELKEALKSGRATIEVETDERPGEPGIIDIFRKGTTDKIGERPLRDSERQQDMFDGADGAPAEGDLSDEQAAALTPAEAEALRARRLEAEHNESVRQEVEAARTRLKVTPQDGGGFLAALDVEGGEPLRELGETEDEATEKVLKLYVDTLPKFEPPAPTWDEVQAAGEAQADEEAGAAETATDPALAAGAEGEVAALAAEQAADAAADAPKALLKAPKGGKAKRIRIVDEQDRDLMPAPAPAPAPDAEGKPRLCEPECDLPPPHEHTAERTAF